MGYYTVYNLNAFDTKDDAIQNNDDKISKKSWDAAKTLATYDYFDEDRYNESFGKFNPFYFVNVEEMKWYGYNSDMRNLSLEYPDLWFRLDGDGENYDDKWVSIFHNGICSTIQIQYYWPEFDESVWEEDNES